MHNISRLWMVSGLTALMLSLGSCGDQAPSSEIREIIEAVESGLTIGGATTSSKVIPTSGDSFFLKVTSTKAWTLSVSYPERANPAEQAGWVSLNINSGEPTRDQAVVVSIQPNEGVQRQAMIILRDGEDSYAIQVIQQPKAGVQPIQPTPVPTPTPTPTPPSSINIPAGEYIDGEPTRIEIPALAGGSNNYFISHKTADGVVNYSLEYDVDRRHPRWVAFVFDNYTSAQNHTRRTNAWGWDSKIPSRYSTDNWFSGSGYSRGHMVASSDRYYSKQANEQTFYYSNMTPQNQDHNGGIWNQLEQLVQGWGRNAGFRDVLYVAKGGTIRDGQISTRKLNGKMVIPQYYYMAMVVKKGDAYHGIAFWTEHRKYTKTSLSSLAISIDELEQRTGIDFFHNLPDDIEQVVEAETLSSHRWPGL